MVIWHMAHGHVGVYAYGHMMAIYDNEQSMRLALKCALYVQWSIVREVPAVFGGLVFFYVVLGRHQIYKKMLWCAWRLKGWGRYYAIV